MKSMLLPPSSPIVLINILRQFRRRVIVWNLKEMTQVDAWATYLHLIQAWARFLMLNIFGQIGASRVILIYPLIRADHSLKVSRMAGQFLEKVIEEETCAYMDRMGLCCKEI